MKTHQFLRSLVIALGVMALSSCTQGQMQQVLGNTTQDMISGPCPTGAGLLSAAPEFCLYVTDLRVTNDTGADVDLTVVNRTGRTVYLKIPSLVSLSDSTGTKWENSGSTGIASYVSGNRPLPLDPNVNSQISFAFRQKSRPVPPDATFSMSGEVMVFRANSRGEMVLQVAPIATRGFQFSRIRQGQQESPQKPTASSPQGAQQAVPVSSLAATDIRGPEPSMSAPVTTSAPAPLMPAKIQDKSSALGTAQDSPNGTAPAYRSLPRGSLDVLGIKVGTSTVADVRTALAKVTPPLFTREHQAQLRGQTRAGSSTIDWIDIDNGKYLSMITGISQNYKDSTQCQSIAGNPYYAQKGNCEQIQIGFSAPPNTSTALHLRRVISFFDGPSPDSVLKALTEKYGEPGFQKIAGDNGISRRYVWAWSPEGEPVRLNEQHPCAVLDQAGMGEIIGGENSQAKMQAGCAAVLHAQLQQNNNVVKYMTLVAIDDFSISNSVPKTSALVKDFVSGVEKKEREKAAKIGAPKF